MAKEGPGLDITELRLGLPGSSSPSMDKNDKKRVFSGIANDENSSSSEQKTQTKNQIVGWPPVCSYRKNSFKEKEGVESSKFYVKVSMDGAPFLRKIDLNTHKGYSDLAVSFEKLFGCFGIGGTWKDSDSSEYIPIYEDKDGDWMLVGDVPWEMFIESCKRLRIMKRSDAKGFRMQSNCSKRNSQEQATDETQVEWINLARA
ncbi:hypothetical protein HHK36_025707 [Tetracentron sinense]|uniref:Auxin-responsive protein n=1 Tax=Tetracentron sinense TaxID=13715 RepID=A0A834YI62_TETSI|nr:hypothetical protein HHK36_025707 [Tetracentron sinense]